MPLSVRFIRISWVSRPGCRVRSDFRRGLGRVKNYCSIHTLVDYIIIFDLKYAN